MKHGETFRVQAQVHSPPSYPEAAILEEECQTLYTNRVENETSKRDEATIAYRCMEAKGGALTLLVDSGAEVSLVKRSALGEMTPVNGHDRQKLVGAFGGEAYTLGSTFLAYSESNVAQNAPVGFKMQVVPDNSLTQWDGILGRDNLWGRAIIDSVKRQLILVHSGQKEIVIPMGTRSHVSEVWTLKGTVIPARSTVLIPVRVDPPDTDIIVHKCELQENAYTGEALTRAQNGIGYIPLLNANTHEVEIKAGVPLEHSLFEEEYAATVCHNERVTGNDQERLNKIWQALTLDNSLNKEELDSVRSVCRDYGDIFQLEGEPLTYTDVLKHEIPTLAGVPPVNIRQYRLPEAHKTEINRQVQEMLDAGIVAPSVSPWNAPIILVPKKPGINGTPK